jgi:hypothetical protein
MNKSQLREIKTLETMYKLGMIDNVALGLSALVRCAMTRKSRDILYQYAIAWNINNHPQFMC